ncbi:MAG TPA: hypothetical protein VN436_16900, partial [Holophaga sp.]|nr:hypothetical protein [Holophaga sp.]
FPTGQPITSALLERVDEAEEILRAAGFPQCRVRCHGDLARIELPPEDIGRLAAGPRETLAEALRGLGFRHVALDLGGYRMGGMNG